ncbi:MAG TPA: hypothetical protein VK031_06665 [Tissierellaceae bacterium]|nr:hypothetical protein [Tissierellaceae bacterium]
MESEVKKAVYQVVDGVERIGYGELSIVYSRVRRILGINKKKEIIDKYIIEYYADKYRGLQEDYRATQA